MRLYGVANDALVLPAAQGGIPLLHSDAAWAATAFPEPLDGRFVDIPWMLETVDPLKQPHVFLSLRHQTDPTENGTYKYDLTTGNQTDEDGDAQGPRDHWPPPDRPLPPPGLPLPPPCRPLLRSPWGLPLSPVLPWCLPSLPWCLPPLPP